MSETNLVNNWLLASMSEADQLALRPVLFKRQLATGEVLFHAGAEVSQIHFPVSALIANVMAFPMGETLAVSMIGRDSLTGLAAFMANEPIGWDAIVHVGGSVWTAPADSLRALAEKSPHLSSLLLQATHQAQLEAHTKAICAAFHAVIPRLSTWLLTLQDRTGLSSFELTQDSIAKLLGVRRSTVNGAFKDLRRRGALTERTRSRIVIIDRETIRATACACYARTTAAAATA